MSHLYSRLTIVNSNKDNVNTLDMVEEIRRHAIGLLFGHVGIQIENTDYLICVHGAKSNRTLPAEVIFIFQIDK